MKRFLCVLLAGKQMMVLDDVAEKTGFLDKVYETEKPFMIADDGNIYAFPYAGQEYLTSASAAASSSAPRTSSRSYYPLPLSASFRETS